MIKLREDQEDVRGKLRVALRGSSSVLAFAPTGFGKTVLAAALIKILLDAGKRVIFAVHRVDLIKQTSGTFEKFGIPFSYIAAGYHFNPYHRVFIASILTLKNRLGRIPADYIFVDEAHLSAAAGWASVAAHYKDEGAKLIGLTGSPERLDGKPLGDVWDKMVMGPSVRWLIDNGHLSRYRAFAPRGVVDTSGLHTRKGEFVASEIDALMEGKAVIAGAAKHWRAKADGLRTIAFCPSVARAKEYAAEFSALGIPSVALDAETPHNERVQETFQPEQALRHILRSPQNGIFVLLDIHHFLDNALVQPESRAIFKALLSQGWVDALRKLKPEPEKLYSWWSYRAADWKLSNKGRRLDHVWLSPALGGSLAAGEIISPTRGWERPSDHVPVMATLEL